ncbi:hypothetical protein [Pseudomonas sp. NPDC089569]|uniref:hypothetical protein n=1 Tax=Pseudomonas sp. NPDC089569 TaxID=3390722 RepID=UPI003D01FD90
MKMLKSIAFGLALAIVSLSAGAYESDLHFGLTWWLARQAGFNLQQSQEIARQDELTDTGMLDAKHAMIWELCIWQNTKASETTRAMHFRSAKAPPAEPPARKVTEDAVYAEAQTRSIIFTHGHDNPKIQSSFGQALHGRQDAYSHAGQSDTLWPPCKTKWLWTHPVDTSGEDKGGMFSHYADQTYTDKAKCVRAASKTYNLMLQFRETMTLTSTPKKLDDLTASIEKFCAAETKVQKAKWFVDEHVPQADAIARNTSLEDGGRSFEGAPRMDLRPGPPSANAVETPVPEYEQQEPGWLPPIEIDQKVKDFLMGASLASTPTTDAFVQKFLKTWLTTPPDKLQPEIERLRGRQDLLQAYTDTMQLLRLRLKDQGKADHATFKAYGINPDAYVTFTEDNWSTGLIPVRGTKAPALVGENGGKIVVIAILRNAPNEVLIMEVTPDYQIAKIQTLIAH